MNKNNFQRWHSQALGYIKAREYEKAVRALDFALVIDPQSADAWYYKAFALGCLSRLEEALACYDRAMACDPENLDLLCYKGFALCELGRFAEAQELFLRCLKRDPRHVLALVNASERWLCDGEIAKAVRAARKALRLTTDTEFILIARWLLIAAWAFKGEREKMFDELDKMMDYLKSFKRMPRLTDWNFDCVIELFKARLDPSTRKLMSDLISLLLGKRTLARFPKIPRPSQARSTHSARRRWD